MHWEVVLPEVVVGNLASTRNATVGPCSHAKHDAGHDAADDADDADDDVIIPAGCTRSGCFRDFAPCGVKSAWGHPLEARPAYGKRLP